MCTHVYPFLGHQASDPHVLDRGQDTGDAGALGCTIQSLGIPRKLHQCWNSQRSAGRICGTRMDKAWTRHWFPPVSSERFESLWEAEFLGSHLHDWAGRHWGAGLSNGFRHTVIFELMRLLRRRWNLMRLFFFGDISSDVAATGHDWTSRVWSLKCSRCYLCAPSRSHFAGEDPNESHPGFSWSLAQSCSLASSIGMHWEFCWIEVVPVQAVRQQRSPMCLDLHRKEQKVPERY